MFAKKVDACFWVNETASGKKKQRFAALYVFDDGYKTQEKCEKAIEKLGLTQKFACISFCGQWYGLSMQSTDTHIVVTKENVYFSLSLYAEYSVYPIKEAKHAWFAPFEFRMDKKFWQDGIYRDLLMVDPNALVVYEGVAHKTGSFAANALVCFGLHFFKTEICIRTDAYTEHAFAHYFGNRELRDISGTIAQLRADGYEYYNPFTKEKSRNYKESHRKTKALLLDVDMANVKSETKAITARQMYSPKLF